MLYPPSEPRVLLLPYSLPLAVARLSGKGLDLELFSLYPYLLLYLSVYATLEKGYISLHRLAEYEDCTHSRSTPWVESRPNRYTADQSPCWWGNHLSKGILRAPGLFQASQGLPEANRVGQGVHH